ncbi:hypothetical protein K501DRAFT_281095 [Backusella circina FSU 941]|nr:hypothetical protein K501DRAFT_281095 [Backusella circina FSU 941]
MMYEFRVIDCRAFGCSVDTLNYTTFENESLRDIKVTSPQSSTVSLILSGFYLNIYLPKEKEEKELEVVALFNKKIEKNYKLSRLKYPQGRLLKHAANSLMRARTQLFQVLNYDTIFVILEIKYSNEKQ